LFLVIRSHKWLHKKEELLAGPPEPSAEQELLAEIRDFP
jgi:hypothetical protein